MNIDALKLLYTIMLSRSGSDGNDEFIQLEHVYAGYHDYIIITVKTNNNLMGYSFEYGWFIGGELEYRNKSLRYVSDNVYIGEVKDTFIINNAIYRLVIYTEPNDYYVYYGLTLSDVANGCKIPFSKFQHFSSLKELNEYDKSIIQS